MKNSSGNTDSGIRNFILSILLISFFMPAYAQKSLNLQHGITAEENLKAIARLAPYSDGGVGFDTRYEGLKGSPGLFDTLVASYLKVKGQDYYVSLKTNINLVDNALMFIHPSGGKLLQIPSDIVTEVVYDKDDEQLVYRTIEGKTLDRDLNKKVFCQVLMEKPVLFLKVPLKNMVEADYQRAYSPDRRYDELITYYRYYLKGSDSAFHQIQLSKKPLLKLYPGKKSVIDKGFKNADKSDKEKTVISILESF